MKKKQASFEKLELIPETNATNQFHLVHFCEWLNPLRVQTNKENVPNGVLGLFVIPKLLHLALILQFEENLLVFEGTEMNKAHQDFENIKAGYDYLSVGQDHEGTHRNNFECIHLNYRADDFGDHRQRASLAKYYY